MYADDMTVDRLSEAGPGERVSRAGRILDANGHSDYIWGHVALRDPEGRGFWLKRSGIGFDEVAPQDVILYGFDGEVLMGEGRPHLEWPIHAAVMLARPDVAATVHTHPPHALALGASARPLRAYSQAGTLFSPPDVARFSETSVLIDTLALGEAVAAAIGDQWAVLMVNHGILVAGDELETAVARAIVLEDACRQQLLTESLTGNGVSASDEDALTVRAVSWSASSLRGLWNYLERSLLANG